MLGRFMFYILASLLVVESVQYVCGPWPTTHGPDPGALRVGWLIFNPPAPTSKHTHTHTLHLLLLPLLHPAILLRPVPGAGGREVGGADVLEKSHGQEWGGGSFLSKMVLLKPENYK